MNTAESNGLKLDAPLSEHSGCGQSDRSKNRGATLVEYVLLLALVTLVCLAAMQLVGSRVSQRFSGLASNLVAAP